MPLTGFRIDDAHYDFASAPAALDAAGIMPAAAVQEVIDKEARSGAEHSFISPSGCNPESTCRRERLIKEFLPYEADPRSSGEMWEGTLVHDALAGGDLGTEVVLPPQTVDARDVLWEKSPGGILKQSSRLKVTNQDATWEVFPDSGIFMKGTLDLVDGDITDYKTSRGSGKQAPYQPPAFATKHEIQLNIYGYLAEDFGIPFKNLWVWRMFRGSADDTTRWRKFPIPRVPRDAMWRRIGGWLTEWNGWHARCLEMPGAIEDIIKAAPLEGQHLFVSRAGGNKCSDYCSVRGLCDKLAGALAW